ncbi:hypothetical protein [Lysinibacter sp. HNR]|uniref:hypothetical protein n=1 Tax=Lysinibacter sp. HNR TaxID=3031408 RepID=UPI0024351EB8|nr:hypothetical protein [Lysinibacter sp. HNR]WGD38486.1 hypothetical protein FrondiHNR_06135 [Lysinibacter sp. HNR]
MTNTLVNQPALTIEQIATLILTQSTPQRVAIIAPTHAIATDYLTLLSHHIPNDNIKQHRHAFGASRITLHNGTIINAHNASTDMRGRTYDYIITTTPHSYIQRFTPHKQGQIISLITNTN